MADEAATSSASSRSVASLSTGCRTTRVPSAAAAATASGDAESKSPTATATSRPSARACSSPPSAATTTAPSGTRSNPSARGDSPPATTTTLFSDTPSSAGITQVRFRGSAAPRAALSARLSRAPRYARAIVAPGPFVDELAAARIGGTFNQYRDSRLRRERLRAYLESDSARRSCSWESPGLSRRTCVRHPVHLGAPAHGPRPRGGDRDDRPPGARRARSRGDSSSSGTSCPRTRGRRRRTDRRRARKSRQAAHRAFAGAREARRRRRAGGARRPRRRLRPSSVTRRRAGVPGGAG